MKKSRYIWISSSTKLDLSQHCQHPCSLLILSRVLPNPLLPGLPLSGDYFSPVQTNFLPKKTSSLTTKHTEINGPLPGLNVLSLPSIIVQFHDDNIYLFKLEYMTFKTDDHTSALSDFFSSCFFSRKFLAEGLIEEQIKSWRLLVGNAVAVW